MLIVASNFMISSSSCLSNRTNTLKEVYEKNKNEKKDEYLERVLNVEKATFTPAVFLTSGGMSKECKQFCQYIDRSLSQKEEGEVL